MLSLQLNVIDEISGLSAKKKGEYTIVTDCSWFFYLYETKPDEDFLD